MIRTRFGITAGLVLGMALAACSSNKNETRTSLLADVAKQAAGSVKNRGKRPKGKIPYTVITQKQLENTKVAALQVNLERRGGSDVLRRTLQRRDGSPGLITVWTGAGGRQVITRGGVLIGTRGIGGDIISADVRATEQAVKSMRTGGGERRYFLSDGGYSDEEVVLSCDIDNLGRATTQVVHLTYQTVHMRETCVGGESDRVRIVNEYWVQPKSGIVRRSRQWAGPYTGYFELIVLRN